MSHNLFHIQAAQDQLHLVRLKSSSYILAHVLDVQSQETLSLMTRPPFSGTNPALWVGCDVSTKKGISHHLISLHNWPTTLKRSQTKAKELKNPKELSGAIPDLLFSISDWLAIIHSIFSTHVCLVANFKVQSRQSKTTSCEAFVDRKTETSTTWKMESIDGYDAWTCENHRFSSLGNIIYNNGFDQNLFGITDTSTEHVQGKATNCL